MSLNQEIQALSVQYNKALSEEARSVIQADNERLAKSGIADNALKTGDKAPPFSLPNARAATVSSVDLLARGPLVLSFYRGGW
jgi:hypothetical protein